MIKNEITFLRVEIKPWSFLGGITPIEYQLEVKVTVDGQDHYAKRALSPDHLESFFDQIMDQVKKEMKYYLKEKGE